MTAAPYREPDEVYEDVREWDIVAMWGTLRIMGLGDTHLKDCKDAARHGWRHECHCLDGWRMTSPLVDQHGAPFYFEGGPDVLDPRFVKHLLRRVTHDVLSGKTYRLVGPRRPEPWLNHEPFTLPGRPLPPAPPPVPWHRRALTWLCGASR